MWTKEVETEQTRCCDNLLLCSADGPDRSVVTVGLASSLDDGKLNVLFAVIYSLASITVHDAWACCIINL